MDGTLPGSVNPPLHEASPPYPQCSDCGEQFEPGHLCRASMEREVAQARAAFLMAIQTIGKIRNMTMVWRRGEETQRLKEIGKITSKTLADIQELIYKSTEEMNGSDAVGNSQSGGI